MKVILLTISLLIISAETCIASKPAKNTKPSNATLRVRGKGTAQQSYEKTKKESKTQARKKGAATLAFASAKNQDQKDQKEFQDMVEDRADAHIETPVFSFDLMFDQIKNKYTKEELENSRQKGLDITVEIDWEVVEGKGDKLHYIPLRKKSEVDNTHYHFTHVNGQRLSFAINTISRRTTLKKEVIFRPIPLEGCCVIL